MHKEPKYITERITVGRLEFAFIGEQFPGLDVLDTRVEIMGHTLCWITWADKKAFCEELNIVIDQFKI